MSVSSSEGPEMKNIADISKSSEEPVVKDSELHGDVVNIGDYSQSSMSTLAGKKSCEDESNPPSSLVAVSSDERKETALESSVVKETGNNDGSSQSEGTSAIKPIVIEEKMSDFQNISQSPVNIVKSSKDSFDDDEKSDVPKDSGATEGSYVKLKDLCGRMKQLYQIVSTELDSQSFATTEKSRRVVSATHQVENENISPSSLSSLPSAQENEPTKDPPVIQKAISSPVLPIEITVVNDSDVETAVSDCLEPIEIGEECTEEITGTPLDTTAQSTSNDEAVECITETPNVIVGEITDVLSSDKCIDEASVKPVGTIELFSCGEYVECIKETSDNSVGVRTDKSSWNELVECIKEVSDNPINTVESLTDDKPTECIKETSDTPIGTMHSISNNPAEFNEQASSVANPRASPTENVCSEDAPQNEERKAFFYISSSELPPERQYEDNTTSIETSSSWQYERLEEPKCLGSKSCHASLIVCSIVVALIGWFFYKLAHQGKMPEIYETVGLSFSATAGVVCVFSMFYISYLMCFPDLPNFPCQMIGDVETATSMERVLHPEVYASEVRFAQNGNTFKARLSDCCARQRKQSSQPQDPQSSQPQDPQSSQPQDPQSSQPQDPQAILDNMGKLAYELEKKLQDLEKRTSRVQDLVNSVQSLSRASQASIYASAELPPESENSVSEGTVSPSKKDD